MKSHVSAAVFCYLLVIFVHIVNCCTEIIHDLTILFVLTELPLLLSLAASRQNQAAPRPSE